jgi:hypothetical protein
LVDETETEKLEPDLVRIDEGVLYARFAEELGDLVGLERLSGRVDALCSNGKQPAERERVSFKRVVGNR